MERRRSINNLKRIAPLIDVTTRLAKESEIIKKAFRTVMSDIGSATPEQIAELKNIGDLVELHYQNTKHTPTNVVIIESNYIFSSRESEVIATLQFAARKFIDKAFKEVLSGVEVSNASFDISTERGYRVVFPQRYQLLYGEIMQYKYCVLKCQNVPTVHKITLPVASGAIPTHKLLKIVTAELAAAGKDGSAVKAILTIEWPASQAVDEEVKAQIFEKFENLMVKRKQVAVLIEQMAMIGELTEQTNSMITYLQGFDCRS
jgi:hypothetical protein